MTAALGGAAAVGACVAGLLAMEPVVPGDGTGGGTAAPAKPRAAAASRADDPLSAARQAVDRAPDDPVAWGQLAHAEIERARTTLDTDRLDAAGKALRRSLSLKEDGNYRAVTGMGQLANARHEFTEGRAWGLRSTRMAPDRADGYGVLADAEIQLGHYGAARTAVQRMLDLKPDAAAYSRAAYDLETHGRFDDAAVSLERAAESAQTPGEAAFAEARTGELAWAQGDVKRAEHHFERALDEVPRHPYAESGLARLYAARGRTEKAVELYDRLTARTPLPQFLLEAAELKLSRSGARSEERSEARAGAELAGLRAQLRMLRAKGGPADPHLALYAADHGDPAVAVGLMRQEWKRSRSVIVADALGWALHRAGRDAEALPYVRAAARTGWQNASFLYHRGVIERRLGREAAGDRLLRKALRLNPHFSQLHAPRASRLLSGEGGTHDGGEKEKNEEE